MKKRLFAFIMIFFFSIFNIVDVKANEISLISGAKSGILIEQSTKEILYEKNKDEKLSPASMTKIMTMILIYEAMENNQFNKNTILTASKTASEMGGSQIYLKVEEKISVDEALKSLAIVSANDCAVLLAEEVAGSEKAFVSKMNQKAKELGCDNTNFNDCTGLSEDNHYTSAYDMSLMASYLLNNYPDVLNYTNIKEDYIRNNTDNPFWLVNTNKLIGRVEGINGLKTGYTSFSGYCITLSMNQNNMNLISVVFGYDSALKRNSESLELLKYGFSNYKMDLVLKKDTTLKKINHILYKNEIEIIVKEDIYYLCKKSDNFNYSYEFQYNEENYNGNLDIYNNNELILNKDITLKNEPIKKNIWEVFISILNKCFV